MNKCELCEYYTKRPDENPCIVCGLNQAILDSAIDYSSKFHPISKRPDPSLSIDRLRELQLFVTASVGILREASNSPEHRQHVDKDGADLQRLIEQEIGRGENEQR